jgi:alpha-L-arabinofuranosidase
MRKPAQVWPNGLRKDLVQLWKDLEPGFLRFPGGCIVEGRFLDKRYRWKATIGDLAEREVLINRWNQALAGKASPFSHDLPPYSLTVLRMALR